MHISESVLRIIDTNAYAFQFYRIWIDNIVQERRLFSAFQIRGFTESELSRLYERIGGMIPDPSPAGRLTRERRECKTYEYLEIRLHF